jgi:hypothetical protein
MILPLVVAVSAVVAEKSPLAAAPDLPVRILTAPPAAVADVPAVRVMAPPPPPVLP